MNFGLKTKCNKIEKIIEAEKLFNNITNEKEINKSTIINDPNGFQAKLKTFSISFLKDRNYNNLSKEEKEAIKTLKNNKDIIIQRLDKGAE